MCPRAKLALSSASSLDNLQAQKSCIQLGHPTAFEPSSASASTETFRNKCKPDKCKVKPLLGQTVPSQLLHGHTCGHGKPSSPRPGLTQTHRERHTLPPAPWCLLRSSHTGKRGMPGASRSLEGTTNSIVPKPPSQSPAASSEFKARQRFPTTGNTASAALWAAPMPATALLPRVGIADRHREQLLCLSHQLLG